MLLMVWMLRCIISIYQHQHMCMYVQYMCIYVCLCTYVCIYLDMYIYMCT